MVYAHKVWNVEAYSFTIVLAAEGNYIPILYIIIVSSHHEVNIRVYVCVRACSPVITYYAAYEDRYIM
jgi:hypothetical protein